MLVSFTFNFNKSYFCRSDVLEIPKNKNRLKSTHYRISSFFTGTYFRYLVLILVREVIFVEEIFACRRSGYEET